MIHSTQLRLRRVNAQAADDNDFVLDPNYDFESKIPLHQFDADKSNQPYPVEKRGLWFYVAFFGLVVPVYSITPASVLYVSWWTFHWGSQGSKQRFGGGTSIRWWEAALLAYATFEVLFAVYYQYASWKIRRNKSYVKSKDIHHLQLIFTRVLQTNLARPQSPHDPPRAASPAEFITPLKRDDPRAIDFRHHLRKWFWFAPWRHITRHSLRSWLSWAIFDKYQEALGSVEKLVLEETLLLVEKRCGGRLDERRRDHGEEVVPMHLTLDPINIWSRPASAYLIPAMANQVAKWWFVHRLGMTYGSYNGIEYLIRFPNDRATAQEPLVFMHGLGVGLVQYSFPIIRIISRIPRSQPLLIPLQRHISQTVFHPNHLEPLEREEFTKGLKDLLLSLGWGDGVTVFSHSKGSLAHSWMLKSYPELIRRSCFIDPVIFNLWEGDLAYNFCYKSPTKVIELLMRYFVASEPGIANAVFRHFDWSANSLWYEEIPHAREPYYAAFFLGGDDEVYNAPRVQKYLARHGIDEGIHFDPHGRHGQAILDPRKGHGLDQLIDWLIMSPPEEASEEEYSDEDSLEEEIDAELTTF